MQFLFYAFYLLAAEVPIFLILYLRSLENNSINNIMFILILISISLNILLCLYLLWKKEMPPLGERVLNYNENNSSISDFFSFFLLPFFTFSLSSDAQPIIFILEIGILFLLLSTLLFKTNNLSANIIFYALFKNYTISTTGKGKINILILSPLTIEDFLDSNETDNIIKVNRKYYLYYGENRKRFIFCVWAAIVFLILTALFIIYLPFLLNKLEMLFA